MPVTVEVYADVVCPFAYIGLHRLLTHRARIGRPDVVFGIRSWPLEVVNGGPVDPHYILEEIEEVAPQVAPDLFKGFDPGAFPASSVPALALTHAAYEKAATVGERVAMELRNCLFERGLDVSDRDLLCDIARAHDLDTIGDHGNVLREYEEGRARGVVGSPHFFTESASMFCPVLRIERVDGRLEVSVDETTTAAIVDACFGSGPENG